MMLMFRSAARLIVVLAATAALAQSGQPGTTPGAPIVNRPGLAGRRGPVRNTAADPQGLVAMREQVQSMESAVSQMRVELKEMQAKAAKSKATDSLTKANLHMWELMVGHLDKELQQLHATLATREDMEARRASLYRQADAKADAEAQAYRAAQSAQVQQNAIGTPTPVATEQPTGQSAGKSPATQTAPAQPSALPPNNNTASPHLP